MTRGIYHHLQLVGESKRNSNIATTHIMPSMPHMSLILVCFELLASTYQVTLDALVSGENVVLQKKMF